MAGIVFSDYGIVKELIEKTTTATGLEVTARIVDKKHQIGIKTNKNEVDYERIRPNGIIPELSYLIAA
jgi:hypothetical protein